MKLRPTGERVVDIPITREQGGGLDITQIHGSHSKCKQQM